MKKQFYFCKLIVRYENNYVFMSELLQNSINLNLLYMILLNSRKVLIICFFALGVFLVSCEKEKVKYENGPLTGQQDLPSFCDDCHSNTLPEHANNSHAKHTTGLYAYNCTTCHFGQGWDMGTHMNGEKNVSFDPKGLATRYGQDRNTPKWDPETKTCSNIYCHSNGITADRGTDGTYTWSPRNPPFGTVKYATTPSWDNGKITGCSFCHNGKGNMTFPYLVERPNTMSLEDYPESGQHQKAAHMSNNQELSSAPYATPVWDGVQCFWCHSATATDPSSIDGPILQGTYSTKYHIDGNTYFKPVNISQGGTMANGVGYSINGTEAHCGSGKKCW
jgi:predicted CxxxxCH...CXXCH cytochrome family protein